MSKGDREDILSLNLHLLHYVGLWSFTDENYRSSWRAKAYPFFSAFMVSSFLSFFISGLANIYFILDDLETTSQNISVSVTNLLNFIKMIPFLFFKDRLVKIVKTVDRDLPTAGAQFDLDKQTVINSKTKSLRRKIMWILYIQLLPTNTLLNLSYFYSGCTEDPEGWTSIANETACMKALPFNGWFPFDVKKSPLNFATAYCFQVVTSLIDTLQIAAMDSFYLVLILHMCSQFDILNAALRELIPVRVQNIIGVSNTAPNKDINQTLHERQGVSKISVTSSISGYAKNGNELVKSKRMNCKMVQDLKLCIRFHQTILRHASNVCLVLDQLMLGECLVMTFILCLISFHASTISPSSMQFLSVFGFFACESSQLLLYCWVGSRLIWKSTSVHSVIYETDWYGSPIEMRRTIQFFMMRAQKPVKITASRFSVVSLDLFMVLLRLSYSYFTLLRQMHNGDHNQDLPNQDDGGHVYQHI